MLSCISCWFYKVLQCCHALKMKDGQRGLTKSHIKEHKHKTETYIDWQNYSVLARASNDYYPKIKEIL